MLESRSMKKVLAIVVLGLLWSGNTYSFETFKPLSNLNLKMHNSIEELYSSINDQKNKECQISFFHNGTYSTEYLNSTISDSDFIAIANIKNKEFNVYCNKLVHKIKDSKNKLTFSKNETDNTLTKKSFIQKFLSSLRHKMYGNKK